MFTQKLNVNFASNWIGRDLKAQGESQLFILQLISGYLDSFYAKVFALPLRLNWKTCKEVEKSLTMSRKCKKLFLYFNFLRIYVKLNKETTEQNFKLNQTFLSNWIQNRFFHSYHGLVSMQDFLAIRFMQSQTELKLRKKNQSGKSAIDHKLNEKTLKKLFLNFYQKTKLQNETFPSFIFLL